jgi:hypothetical protein
MHIHPTALVETPHIGEGTRAVCGACGREFEGMADAVDHRGRVLGDTKETYSAGRSESRWRREVPEA